MFGRGNWLQVPFVIVALVLGGWAARYAFSQGMHTVIASQSPPTKTQPAPLQVAPLSGCGLGSDLRYDNPLRCQMEMRQAQADARDESYRLVFHAPDPPAAPAVATMNKADSASASGWFSLALLAIPLSLGIAAILGFLVLRTAAVSKGGSWG